MHKVTMPEPSLMAKDTYTEHETYGYDADDMEAYAAAKVREATDWISVSDRLPEIGDWVNVLLDRNEGDYFDRRGKQRYSIYGAQLREVDNEGFATWQRWQMSDGGPMGALYLVTHWKPLPLPPENDNEQEIE